MGARLLPCGDSGLLVELGDTAAVLALHGLLSRALPAGVVDLVPAARTLLLQLDPRSTTVRAVSEELSEILAAGVPAGSTVSSRDVVEVPVVYDGDDLAEVGRLTGLGATGVAAAHQAAEWTVAFCGFAPGFGYLVGGDPRLTVPRREVPRTRVPAGAVALAGPFTGVYPRSSPGGWQLIGRTDVVLWDTGRDPVALLRPGVRVRFVAAVPR